MLDGQCPKCRSHTGLRFLRSWKRIWRRRHRHVYAARWLCTGCIRAWWSIQPALTTRALDEFGMTAPKGVRYRSRASYGQDFPRTLHLDAA